MTACTQQSVVKSTALRHVIEEYETQVGQETDKNKSSEQRKQTRIDVEKVEMISDDEANVTIQIQDPLEAKHVTVHLLKKDGRWSVQK